MKHIYAQLPSVDPSEVLYEIKFDTVLSAISHRGYNVVDLSPEDLELAREEVQAALDHHLNEKDYIDIGLDAWEILRDL